MAAPFVGAPALTKADMDMEVNSKRACLNKQGDAHSQVQLRARSLHCPPGGPLLTHKTAALAVWLGLALACAHATGDASAPKAPSGAGAPLLNTSAQADHYRNPPRWEPTQTCLCSSSAHTTSSGEALVTRPCASPPLNISSWCLTLLNTSAPAVHYWNPPRWEPTQTCLCSSSAHRIDLARPWLLTRPCASPPLYFRPLCHTLQPRLLANLSLQTPPRRARSRQIRLPC